LVRIILFVSQLFEITGGDETCRECDDGNAHQCRKDGDEFACECRSQDVSVTDGGEKDDGPVDVIDVCGLPGLSARLDEFVDLLSHR
jgi:hypothetical protein